MKLTLSKCDDRRKWDEFVARSPQGNVFCTNDFLDATGADYDRLLLEEGGRPLLAAVLPMRDGQPLHSPQPFSMYQGVMLSEEVDAAPAHRQPNLVLKLTDALLAEMERRYVRIAFCLHTRFPDLRSFSWFHYHDRERGVFKIDLRYTAILRLKNYPTFDVYFSGVRTTRQQEYRKAVAAGWTVEESDDCDLLDRLHEMTFIRQGLVRDGAEVVLLRSITAAALRCGFGQLLICRNRDGEVGSATLFLYDQRCGYYLVAANDSSYRNTGCSTLLMVENVRRCMGRQLELVDFVGINSPNRGDYKTSFNGEPIPYFVATWDADTSVGVGKVL